MGGPRTSREGGGEVFHDRLIHALLNYWLSALASRCVLHRSAIRNSSSEGKRDEGDCIASNTDVLVSSAAGGDLPSTLCSTIHILV